MDQVRPSPEDTQPSSHETADRIATGAVTVIPILALAFVIYKAIGGDWLNWSDVIVFAIVYLCTGLGVTVGFHRLFTHRSFKTGKVIRGTLAIFGSAAIEGPVISWVADHRKHHAFSDQEGDPHSPHLHGDGWANHLKGLLHAHVGWLFVHTQRANRQRYAPDLMADPIVRFVDKTFLVWVLAGLAVPFFLGWAIGGTVDAALTGLLWGGAIRMLVLHHVTYSINSLCHFFGRRRFDIDDESRNLAWLSVFSLGESWHHNHHAFPTSARHGLSRWEIDPSGLVIRGLGKVGLAWDIIEISPERQQRKLIAPADAAVIAAAEEAAAAAVESERDPEPVG